jgi:hypothetical protein
MIDDNTSVSNGDGSVPEDLRHLSTYQLAVQLSEETSLFLKQRPSDGRFGVELFRRAVVERDEQAWSLLYSQYAPLVLTWVMQHQGASLYITHEGGPDGLVNGSFAKFAAALTSRPWQFDSLPAILKYLKMCVHSVVSDLVRAAHARACEETLEAIEQEPAEDNMTERIVAAISAEELWTAIRERLRGPAEAMVVYCSYVQGLKPAQIVQDHPGLFPQGSEDVYRIQRNVLERLRRDQHLKGTLRGRN